MNANLILHTSLHRFSFISEYWSNYRFWQWGCLALTHSFGWTPKFLTMKF